MSNDLTPRTRSALATIDNATTDGRLTAPSTGNLRKWLCEPQYEQYQHSLIQLIEANQFEELNRLFWERIPFGTGGRRGPMSEFGSATINARTIAESAAGLAEYVLKWKSGERSESPHRAVIAFDSRHRSDEFARITASVLAAFGFQVHFFSSPRSTPELSFAVRHLNCDTGVMISASHNPPSDNGFKAYWSTGGQVLPPHDAGIIACVDAVTEIPFAEFDKGVANGRIVLLDHSIDDEYVETVARLSLSNDRNITALYTPLHGVGETSVYQVASKAGFEHVTIFEPQRSQDGAFPNVPDHLPNPERTAVFGPAIAEAKRTGVDLVLASDPDADRIAVAVRNDVGDYVCLTGNQLGALLTDYVLRKHSAKGVLSPEQFVIETLVTTPLVAEIARKHGVTAVRDVLVGFKHIAAEIDDRNPEQFLFAAEESIGYMAGTYCRDKDAAPGALYALELAAELKRDGKTLLDRLNELYQSYGYYLEETVSITCPGASGQFRIQQILKEFRTRPPMVTADCAWDTVRDYLHGEVRSLPSNRVIENFQKPCGDMLIFEGKTTNCQIRIAVRPSGTEPKIKFYYFITTNPELPLHEATSVASDHLSRLKQSIQQWMDEVQ